MYFHIKDMFYDVHQLKKKLRALIQD